MLEGYQTSLMWVAQKCKNRLGGMPLECALYLRKNILYGQDIEELKRLEKLLLECLDDNSYDKLIKFYRGTYE